MSAREAAEGGAQTGLRAISIAEWYGVTVGEAKFGPLVLLNQGSTTAWLKELDPPRAVPAKGDHPDLIRLQAEALGVRKLFFEHAATLFPRGAFDGLRARLRADCPAGTLDSEGKMEKKLFSYCLMHFENVALHICTAASAKHGLPALTDIYDGFLQLRRRASAPCRSSTASGGSRPTSMSSRSTATRSCSWRRSTSPSCWALSRSATTARASRWMSSRFYRIPP